MDNPASGIPPAIGRMGAAAPVGGLMEKLQGIDPFKLQEILKMLGLGGGAPAPQPMLPGGAVGPVDPMARGQGMPDMRRQAALGMMKR